MSEASTKHNGIFRYVNIARICLETTTPLSIGSGHADRIFDAPLQRDHDGLPAIPGAAIAGVLRRLWGEGADDIFGCPRPDANDEKEHSYYASRIFTGWARIHDSNNSPPPSPPDLSDTVLKLAAQPMPILRDHVRINQYGTAADEAKFDRGAVPKGARFTFEVILESAKKNDPDWTKLLNLMAHPLLRFGGATRRGYGGMRCIGIVARKFDLKKETDRTAMAGYHPDVSQALPAGFNKITPKAPDEEVPSTVYHFTLAPEGFWRIGSGWISSWPQDADYTPLNPPDMKPATETVIEWDEDQKATIARKIVVPGSSIKGALRHRAAYHWRRKQGKWAVPPNTNNASVTLAETDLFGVHKSGTDGHIGRVIINDVYLELPKKTEIGLLSHNAIDRFTGGTIDQALFHEEALWAINIPINILVLPGSHEKNDDISNVLSLAIEDLKEGRLSLGGGASHGHGYFGCAETNPQKGGEI